MSKQGAMSRWNGNRARFTEEDIDDCRWVKNARGQWRLKEDSVPETQWLQRRHPMARPGWHRGARDRKLRFKGVEIVFDDLSYAV